MKRTRNLMLVVAGVLLIGGAAMAQVNSATGQVGVAAPAAGAAAVHGHVVLTWEEFTKITGYDPTQKGAGVLTIPWSEVETLLGVELKGKVPMDKSTVALPWADFKALLEWSVAKKTNEPPPPADYIVTASQYEVALGETEATFTLTLKLEVLRKAGWKRIPVLPATVAVTDSTLPAGAFLNVAGNVYELLTDKAGPMEAKIKFVAAVTKNAGIYSTGLDRVLPSTAILDLTAEGEQVDAKVAGAQSLVSKLADKKTHVAAAVAGAQPINITWERAVPKAPAEPAKVYAETQTLVAVADGLLLCQEQIDFNILHSPVTQLRLAVPAGVSVLEVAGRTVQDWRVDKSEVLVSLRGEAIGPYDLRVSYEKPVTDSADVPVLRAVGVERDRGFVGVVALANVEIDAGKVDGATTVDVKRLPGDISAMTKQPILLGFRYVGDKFTIPLVLKKHGEVNVLATIVDSALFTTMQLDDGRRITRVVYTVRNNRNQFLRAKMPDKADVWSVAVGGNTVSPGVDEGKNVLIPLIRIAANAQELASFPVEVVYVETPEKAAPASGKLHVAVPTLDSPAMHVMVNYYAPAEGKYGKSGGMFSSAHSGFTGTLRLVNQFATMTNERAAAVVPQNPAEQAQMLQKQFDTKLEAQAQAAGVTPIKVRLPINGKQFSLEKILALPGDPLFFDVEYSGWDETK